MHLMMMDPAKNKGGEGPRRGKEGHLCGEGPSMVRGPLPLRWKGGPLFGEGPPLW